MHIEAVYGKQDKGGITMMKWKCWIAGITAALILAAAPITDAAAQGWQKNSTGWWWEYADGSYPASAWQQVDGIWYWFNADGYMATGWVQVGNTWYYMDPSGAMLTGWVQVGGTWYYMDPSGAMLTGWVQVDGTWYYMDPSGAMQTGWVQVDGTWYYMDLSGAMLTGWVQTDGTWYYMDSSGAMQIGWIRESGTWYYMEADGHWNSSMTNQGYFMTDGQAIVDLINNGCMQETAGRPQPDGSVSVAGSVYWDSSVAAIAQQRAVEISTNFSHTSASGCRPSTYGENIAMGCGDVYTAYNLWYNSEGHKSTMMVSGGCGYACYVAPDGNTYSVYIVNR